METPSQSDCGGRGIGDLISSEESSESGHEGSGEEDLPEEGHISSGSYLEGGNVPVIPPDSS